ncbi:MAG: c-type cytochrome [Rhodothermales bacterium]
MNARITPIFIVVILGVTACGKESTSLPETPEARFERLGRQVYDSYCVTCHQPGGQGIPGSFPPLDQTQWVVGDKGRLIRLILNGMQGSVEVKGELYDNVMNGHAFLSDELVAAVLTHVRSTFGNEAGPVSPDEVAAVRAASEKEGLWEARELVSMTGVPGAEESGSQEE